MAGNQLLFEYDNPEPADDDESSGSKKFANPKKKRKVKKKRKKKMAKKRRKKRKSSGKKKKSGRKKSHAKKRRTKKRSHAKKANPKRRKKKSAHKKVRRKRRRKHAKAHNPSQKKRKARHKKKNPAYRKIDRKTGTIMAQYDYVDSRVLAQLNARVNGAIKKLKKAKNKRVINKVAPAVMVVIKDIERLKSQKVDALTKKRLDQLSKKLVKHVIRTKADSEMAKALKVKLGGGMMLKKKKAKKRANPTRHKKRKSSKKRRTKKRHNAVDLTKTSSMGRALRLKTRANPRKSKRRKKGMKKRNPIFQGGNMLKLGVPVSELISLAAAGGVSHAVEKFTDSQIGKIPFLAEVKAVPIVGSSVFSVVAGIAAQMAGEKLGQSKLEELGKSLVAVAAVKAGSAAVEFAQGMIFGSSSVQGVDVTKAGLLGVDVSSYGKADYDYMGDVTPEGLPQTSKADFGYHAQMGKGGIPEGMGNADYYAQLGYRPDQLSEADFEGIPEGMSGQMG